MKTIKKLSLNKLNREELENREMNSLVGGKSCGCGCNYADSGGGSEIQANVEANWKNGYTKSYGGNKKCIVEDPDTGGGVDKGTF